MVTNATSHRSSMITSAQIRAARGLLNWTVRDLSEAAGVHRNTVTRIEMDQTGAGPAIVAIQAALEAAGVVFLPDGEHVEGVGLKRKQQKAIPEG